ncbi:MAG TPA: alpha/beta fold hydrolase [Oscillatoriaceae cyanobacterium]
MSTALRWALAPALALAGVGIYLAIGAGRGAGELCHPRSRQTRESPDAYGLPFEEVELRTPDGLRLAAWYVPAEQATDRAVLLLHGHTAARSQMLPHARFLRDYNCLLLDFRNQGDSQPSCSGMGVLEVADVRAALDWLVARGNARLGALGVSMGGAALLREAADDARVRGVVVDGTYARLRAIISKRARDRGYPLSALLARAVVLEASRRTGRSLEALEPEAAIARLAPRPVLIVQGTADKTCPPAQAERLYQAAAEPKTLYWVEGAGHTDAFAVAGNDYELRVRAFFERCLA